MRIEELMHWRLIKNIEGELAEVTNTVDDDDVLNVEPNANLVGFQLK